MGKLVNYEYLRKCVSERFDEHLDLFTFPGDLSNYCENICPDIVNIVNLVTLNSPTRSLLEVTNYNNGNISDKEEVDLSDYVPDRLSNAASLEGNSYKANFVSHNVINLSNETLRKMKFPSSQIFFSLFLPLNILIKHCSENFKILVRN